MKNDRKVLRRNVLIIVTFIKIIISIVIIMGAFALMTAPYWITFILGLFCLLITAMVWIPVAERTIKTIFKRGEVNK